MFEDQRPVFETTKLSFFVGVGRQELPLTLGGFLAGHRKPRRMTGVHSKLHVRALAIEKETERLLLLSYELLWLERSTCQRLRHSLAAVAGTRLENVMITCTHTHSSPDAIGMYPDMPSPSASWIDSLVSAGHDAAVRALRGLSPCVGTKAQIPLGLGISRRLRLPGCTVRLPNPFAQINDTMTVLRFSRPAGDTVGGVMHAAIHPVYAHRSSTLLSSDFPGALSNSFEVKWGGVWLYLQGASADVTPTSALRGYRAMARAAQSVQKKVSSIAPNSWCYLPPQADAVVTAATVDSKPHRYLDHLRRMELKADRCLRLEVIVWSLGGVIIVALPGEVTGATERAIVGGSPRSVLMVGMANGYYGYFPSGREIVAGGYEARACMLSKSGTEMLVCAAREALERSAAKLAPVA